MVPSPTETRAEAQERLTEAALKPPEQRQAIRIPARLRVRVRTRAEFEAGLTDIEGFSHLYVVWVFHRHTDYDLLSTPPTDTEAHGVFATRAPRRPNPIGLTVVQLEHRDGPVLHVRGVDMLDGSPILDIKPYLSSIAPEELRRGWLGEAEERRANG